MKNYELETIVTIEADSIEKGVTTPPDANAIALWKKEIEMEVNKNLITILGASGLTARVKVQVFIHEQTDEISD